MNLEEHERLFNVIDQRTDVSKYIEPPKDAHLIQPVASFSELIERELFDAEVQRGLPFPWTTQERAFHLRPGEVTLWAGRRGHWKSFITSQVALDLASQGARICVASLEMPPYQTGVRLIVQGATTRLPKREQLDRFYKMSVDHLWLYARQGRCDSKHILAVARYCAVELGITHFFLDNLTKVLSVSNEDSAKQQAFVNDVCDIANDYKIHMHLVAHVRKSSGSEVDERMPTIDDIRGSGSMPDQVDNVVMCWRNRPKEMGAGSPEQSDLTINVAKQRHGKWEGYIGLWKHPASMQFVTSHNAPPEVYF